MINKRYEKHFLLDAEEAKVYAIDALHYFSKDEPLESKEIGDGNINYVFKIYNTESGKSLVIKQADKFLRSSGRPLDVYRNKIEAEILKIEGTLASEYVPKVYAYDEVMCILAMEDISAYHNLRTELIQGHMYSHLAINIAKFLARTLLPTTDIVMDKQEKKENVKRFINPELCDITEDLVLREPYDDYKNRNIILDANKAFVEEHIYNNKYLKTEVAKLRNKYMNDAQALLHGDLHSGSIFINEEGIKIIDPEFAFYGPMGYDIGNVIGNLYFAWAYHAFVNPNNKEFLVWIEHTIKDVYEHTKKELFHTYDTYVKEPLYITEAFKTTYIDSILSDSLGYAGTEIIRRVIGDSKVNEVSSIQDEEIRIGMERALLKIGIELLTNRNEITDAEQITKQFRLLLA